MKPSEYQKRALSTMADQGKILERLAALGPTAMQLDNAARGLADDAGEFSGAVKKFIEYGRPLDKTNAVEELGDCLWRIAQACDALGVTLEDVMAANLRKLNTRYSDGYSDEAAADENRDRAAEAAAVAGKIVPLYDRRKDPESATPIGEAVVRPDGTAEVRVNKSVMEETWNGAAEKNPRLGGPGSIGYERAMARIDAERNRVIDQIAEAARKWRAATGAGLPPFAQPGGAPPIARVLTSPGVQAVTPVYATDAFTLTTEQSARMMRDGLRPYLDPAAPPPTLEGLMADGMLFPDPPGAEPAYEQDGHGFGHAGPSEFLSAAPGRPTFAVTDALTRGRELAGMLGGDRPPLAQEFVQRVWRKTGVVGEVTLLALTWFAHLAEGQPIPDPDYALPEPGDVNDRLLGEPIAWLKDQVKVTVTDDPEV